MELATPHGILPDLDASDGPVLVAYGSKHGSTAEIAQRIGDRLRESGLGVEVRAAAEVDEVAPYRAVVLGSAVYLGRWRRDATRLLKRRRGELAERDVWLFSSGPLDTDPDSLRRAVPARVKRLAAEIHAHGHEVFGGRLPLEPHGFLERRLVARTPAERRDARDWDAIDAWADAIGDGLREREL